VLFQLQLISYVESYDRVSTSAANRKFGHDVFKECTEDAQKREMQRKATVGSHRY
jgi:hypothetical protein